MHELWVYAEVICYYSHCPQDRKEPHRPKMTTNLPTCNMTLLGINIIWAKVNWQLLEAHRWFETLTSDDLDGGDPLKCFQGEEY